MLPSHECSVEIGLVPESEREAKQGILMPITINVLFMAHDFRVDFGVVVVVFVSARYRQTSRRN